MLRKPLEDLLRVRAFTGAQVVSEVGVRNRRRKNELYACCDLSQALREAYGKPAPRFEGIGSPSGVKANRRGIRCGGGGGSEKRARARVGRVARARGRVCRSFKGADVGANGVISSPRHTKIRIRTLEFPCGWVGGKTKHEAGVPRSVVCSLESVIN